MRIVEPAHDHVGAGADIGGDRRLRTDVFPAFLVDADLDAVGRNVRRTLEQVQDLAPRATVVLVGYPRIVDGSACPRRLQRPPPPSGESA